jgi:hypothetical protein
MDKTFNFEFEDSIKKFGYTLIVTKMDSNFVKLKMTDMYSNIVFEKIFKLEEKEKYKKIIDLFKLHPIDNKKNILEIVENDNEYKSF